MVGKDIQMMPNSFFGKCNFCKEKKEILCCHSWKSQKTKGGFVRGGWYNFCEKCCEIVGETPNRKKKTIYVTEKKEITCHETKKL